MVSKQPIFIFIVVVLILSSCGKQTSQPATERMDTKKEGEKIEVPDALNAQLEALGYVTKRDTEKQARGKGNPYENVDISHFFEGIDGTFVFLDVAREIQLVHNEERAKKRFTPCSTFKIPNTLIALETGVAAGPETKIEWDEKKYPKEPWWDTVLKPMGIDWARDHTLRTAFKNSCVWFYKTIAERIGGERMTTFLKKFDYGNQDISGGINIFWLQSSLEISAVEQVAFLKRFVENGLGLSEKTVRDARIVFEREKKSGAVLYAKTGGGKDIGWFVGFVEKGKEIYIFAFNMTGTYEQTAKKRVDLSIKILQELGVWF